MLTGKTGDVVRHVIVAPHSFTHPLDADFANHGPDHDTATWRTQLDAIIEIGNAEIIQGVLPGELVVVSGNYQLQFVESKSEIPAGGGHGHDHDRPADREWAVGSDRRGHVDRRVLEPELRDQRREALVVPQRSEARVHVQIVDPRRSPRHRELELPQYVTTLFLLHLPGYLLITVLAVTGLTHRQSYKDIGVVCVLIPIVALAVVLALGSAVGSF